LVLVETVAVSVPLTVRFAVDSKAEPGLYVRPTAVWIMLFVSEEFDEGVKVMYRVAAVVVAMVSTMSDPVAWPFIVVHVTVATVRVPEPVIPLPINRAGVDGCT
jgi:hypothetical protein